MGCPEPSVPLAWMVPVEKCPSAQLIEAVNCDAVPEVSLSVKVAVQLLKVSDDCVKVRPRTDVRAASDWKVKWSAVPVAEVPLGVTTRTSIVAADSAGETAKIVVSEMTAKLAATVPK